MLFPLIVVKDRSDGSEHIVGADRHDCLLIDDSGKLMYYNRQNGCGTDDEYRFKGIDDKSSYRPETFVMMVTFEELQQIYEKRSQRDLEHEKELDKVFSALSDMCLGGQKR